MATTTATVKVLLVLLVALVQGAFAGFSIWGTAPTARPKPHP